MTKTHDGRGSVKLLCIAAIVIALGGVFLEGDGLLGGFQVDLKEVLFGLIFIVLAYGSLRYLMRGKSVHAANYVLLGVFCVAFILATWREVFAKHRALALLPGEYAVVTYQYIGGRGETQSGLTSVPIKMVRESRWYETGIPVEVLQDREWRRIILPRKYIFEKLRGKALSGS